VRTAPSSRETLVFRLALAALALHVLADAFVLTEPGTVWSDHLLPGLVQLGLLGLAAWAAPRLRAGAVACLALAFGILAFVPFGVAITHARGAGVGGDDWTAFLAGAAGAVLVGLGVRLLWRTRRPTGRRYLRRSLEALAGLLVVFWVLFPLGLALGATHRPRATEPVADLGRPAEDVTLRTEDGLDLAAWYVPPENGAVVVLFPTRKGSADHARMLVEDGYGVLAVDMRGYDGSEGDPNAFGWGGTKDLAAATAFLESRPEVDEGGIGGLGLSVGGEQLLEAAAENEAFAAVVSEGAGIRSVREAAALGAEGLLAFPQQVVLTGAVAVLSGEAPPPSLLDVAPRISPRAAFFIYAEQGQGGEELSEDYYEAAGEPKELWRTESGHTGGLDADPEEYEQRVVAFFDRTLLGES
jgi:dienelactone hydrolase